MEATDDTQILVSPEIRGSSLHIDRSYHFFFVDKSLQCISQRTSLCTLKSSGYKVIILHAGLISR